VTVAKYKQNHTVSVSKKKKRVVLVTEHNCSIYLRKGMDTDNTTINIWEVLESYGHVGMEMNSFVKVRKERRVVSKRFGQR